MGVLTDKSPTLRGPTCQGVLGQVTSAIGDSMFVMGEENSRATCQPERGPTRFIMAWDGRKLERNQSMLDLHLERGGSHIGQLNGRGTVHHTLLPVGIIIIVKINLNFWQSQECSKPKAHKLPFQAQCRSYSD